jgi:DNA polymerase-4
MARRAASILHVDLDAFYASVEQVRRPELAGKPVAVGGGVVLAASYEARRFGVHSAMPLGRARRLCPGLIVVGGSFGDYASVSDEVFDLCERFTPLVEQISIDEAFLDVSGAGRLFGDPVAIGHEIRREVRRATGLAISVGVASTKFLAKVASRVAKPDGLLLVPAGGEIGFLHPLPVQLLWGVGPVTAARLRDMGIRSVGELAAAPASTLAARLGPGAGHHLHALAWNRDPRPVVLARRAGSVGAQRTFGRDVTDPAVHRKVMVGLADRVGSRLRAAGRAGRVVTATVRFADFVTVTRRKTLRLPVATTEALFRTGHHLAATALADVGAGHGVRLLGISVSGLERTRWLQLELPLELEIAGQDWVASAASAERERLDAAVDGLRLRFGKRSVGPASLLLDASAGVPDEFGDLAIPVAERRLLRQPGGGDRPRG